MSEQFPSRFDFVEKRVKFNPKNMEHRKAAAIFFRTGVWTIKFETQWPFTTVPQTVLMLLSEYACRKEMKEIVEAEGKKYSQGDPFNMHTFSTKSSTGDPDKTIEVREWEPFKS
jgi:hypothetical protein